jgi:hypothetical protein
VAGADRYDSRIDLSQAVRDFGTSRTVDGILTDTDGSLNAWFIDSEGSILGLVEGQGDHMT